ncbi:YjeO family protein [Pectobacterium versatile]|uniref:YjeO family protein n=1 Tax=Pectobacterium versatile TaxID=2488639 RepID=A0A7T0HHV0_9GAMM|nr:YjeO family protein [Pectobacterium versatile]
MNVKKNSYIYNIYFYAYSALCFLINAFSTTKYEWMIDGDSVANFCEVPEADADGILSIIIVPLSIPFFIFKRSLPRIITYIIILGYHSYRFYTRISLCPN